jgi:hypothetical protein
LGGRAAGSPHVPTNETPLRNVLSEIQILHYPDRMEEATTRKPILSERVRSQRFRAGAVIVLAVVVGLILWLALRGNDSPSNPDHATAVSQAQLESLANSLEQPIFWVGPRSGYTYELVRLRNGTINVRYLPSGVGVGTDKPYLSVATYPFVNAYQALAGIKDKNAAFLRIPNGGIAEYSKKYRQSVHAAYPGVPYQVEVYDPTQGTATGLLVSGQLAHLGKIQGPAAGAPKPTAATEQELASLAKSLGHPIYWVGPKRHYTYELMQAQGKVFIRYLPPGVKIGTVKPYLSVGTYPFPKAYTATDALTKSANSGRVDVPAGGVGVYAKGYPQSIHLAYPGSDVQIEVYDPSAVRARALVTSGRVTQIG